MTALTVIGMVCASLIGMDVGDWIFAKLRIRRSRLPLSEQGK